ncbi:MAG: 2TM domain-containing protein [Dokdonia sp.]|mgnify:CR=1 FL=1|jgi:hypothetical protein|nr:histidine kinase [Cytophagaceae bacterium]
MESKEEKFLRAKQRVQELRKYYMGLISFVVFNGILAGINYYVNQWDHMWFLWVTFFWGIGLFFDTAKVFGLQFIFGKNWESKKIKEYMENEEKDEAVNFKRWD